MDSAQTNMELGQLNSDSCLDIEKMDDDTVPVKSKVNRSEHFFATCDFNDMLKFLQDYDISKEKEKKRYMKESVSYKTWAIQDWRKMRYHEETFMLRKSERRDDLKYEREKQRSDSRMLHILKDYEKINDTDILNEEMMDANSIPEAGACDKTDNIDFLSEKMEDIELRDLIEVEKRIEFFDQNYLFHFKNNIFPSKRILDFFKKNKIIDSKKLFYNFKNMKVVEEKLNQWVIEKVEEKQDRTKLKVFLMIPMISDIIRCQDIELEFNDCLVVKKDEFPLLTSLPDLTILNKKQLFFYGFHLSRSFFDIIVSSNIVYLQISNGDLKNNVLLDGGVLQNIISLKHLNLNENNLVKIPPLPINLESLFISYNELIDEGIINLLCLSSIKRLDLSRNKLQKIPMVLSIKVLLLSSNQITSEEEIDKLKFFPQLIRVDLSFNRLTKFPPCIPGNLTNIYVSFNDIRGKCKLEFCGENKLAHIEITGNDFWLKDDLFSLINHLNKGCRVYSGINGAYVVGDSDSFFDKFYQKREEQKFLRDSLFLLT